MGKNVKATTVSYYLFNIIGRRRRVPLEGGNVMSPTPLDVFGVLAPPAGAHGVCEGIFGFLTTRDARALRLVCRLCCI